MWRYRPVYNGLVQVNKTNKLIKLWLIIVLAPTHIGFFIVLTPNNDTFGFFSATAGYSVVRNIWSILLVGNFILIIWHISKKIIIFNWKEYTTWKWWLLCFYKLLLIKWDIVLFGPSFKLNKFKNIHERLNTSIFKKIF